MWWQQPRLAPHTPRAVPPVLISLHALPTPLSARMQVGNVFALSPESVAHAMHLFDRVLSTIQIPREALQTVALACAVIASKLHESRPITARHVKTYFHEICSVEALGHTETNVLGALRWDVGGFTALDFVDTVIALLIAEPALIAAVKERAGGLYFMAVLGEWCWLFLSRSERAKGVDVTWIPASGTPVASRMRVCAHPHRANPSLAAHHYTHPSSPPSLLPRILLQTTTWWATRSARWASPLWRRPVRCTRSQRAACLQC